MPCNLLDDEVTEDPPPEGADGPQPAAEAALKVSHQLWRIAQS